MKPLYPPRCRMSPAGLTVVEILIVIAILAMVVAGSVGVVSNIGNFQLRGEVFRTASALRMVQGRAAINGVRYQVVFDLEGNRYRVECSEDNVLVRTQEEEEEAERAQRTRRFRRADDPEANPFGGGLRAAFDACEDAVVGERTLPDRMQFRQVLTINRRDPVTSGEVAVGFFPDGFVEQAVIWMEHDSGATWAIELEPMTGRVLVHAGEFEVPRDFFDEEEDR